MYYNSCIFIFSPYDLNFRNAPPPLPPKKNSCLTPTGLTNTAPSNVFQPSLLVRTPSNSSSGINNNNQGSNNGPSHLVVTPLNRRTQQRYRVEAKRNSILSSDEEDDEQQHFSTTHRHSLVRIFCFILTYSIIICCC